MTTTPSLQTGTWVQYNVSTQSPLAALPTAAEQTIGIIRQAYTAQGKQFFQVVWNPGSMFPEVGLYSTDELCALTAQQAQQITSQMNSGTYQGLTATPSASYQQPDVPTLALPPALQGQQVTPTLTGPNNQLPLTTGAGYQ